MPRFAYVNGRFVRHADAAVHVEDRGYQFADGVYEVWSVMGGRLGDAPGHFARLERSLGELRIAAPMSLAALKLVLAETVRRNRLREGLIYLQITRGVAPRDHPFPDPPPLPAIVITAKAVDPAIGEARAAAGIAVITVPESRWARCDIKTIALLPNVLAKQAAREAGAAEAWFVDDLGLVTEGGSSNAWIVDADGKLRTRDIQANILRGVTRASLMALAADCGLAVEERPFSVAEARSAREAFITGAGALVMPVTRIDGHLVGGGVPGAVAQRLRRLYIDQARSSFDEAGSSPAKPR
jgi:D-alanine transaminase